MKKQSKCSKLIAIAILAFGAAAHLSAHDEGHTTPGQLPPFGPHGGTYGKLSKHFAEIVVNGDQVRIYILEPDVAYVAEDATGVTAAATIPGVSGRQALALSRDGDGYVATLNIPARARRVIFHVSCVLDGVRENGNVNYEPR